MMHKRAFMSVLLFCLSLALMAKDYRVTSPDGKIIVTVSKEVQVKWNVTYEGREILSSSSVFMEREGGGMPSGNERIRRASVKSIREIIIPVLPNKRSEIVSEYNMKIHLAPGGGYAARIYPLQ